MSSIGYCLVKKTFSEQAFDGEGAKLYGGRWNSKGQSCIYLASTASLAILETMIHIENYELLSSFVLFQIEFSSASLVALDSSLLPQDWKEDPSSISTAQIGDNWLNAGSSLGLYVPSTILPIENNIILNPQHPDFENSLKTVKKIDFFHDSRP
ncbi:MAG: RES family NAD+ phosphorylase [Pseudomonadota bacterium]